MGMSEIGQEERESKEAAAAKNALYNGEIGRGAGWGVRGQWFQGQTTQNSRLSGNGSTLCLEPAGDFQEGSHALCCSVPVPPFSLKLEMSIRPCVCTPKSGKLYALHQAVGNWASKSQKNISSKKIACWKSGFIKISCLVQMCPGFSPRTPGSDSFREKNSSMLSIFSIVCCPMEPVFWKILSAKLHWKPSCIPLFLIKHLKQSFAWRFPDFW